MSFFSGSRRGFVFQAYSRAARLSRLAKQNGKKRNRKRQERGTGKCEKSPRELQRKRQREASLDVLRRPGGGDRGRVEEGRGKGGGASVIRIAP